MTEPWMHQRPSRREVLEHDLGTIYECGAPDAIARVTRVAGGKPWEVARGAYDDRAVRIHVQVQYEINRVVEMRGSLRQADRFEV